ncbi:hypothetical protein MGYG_02418 [Nannizzia gypsea CBS 118893]|uniref:Uncharacterized protein n=1 Tax=Arthroderma gypseum (strain ATCC MYA-4604 / CBS 118893) TaxID=535722 RepID=E4URI4_ARTGP|nr:hypothetical protein MGYG_02418 [Nannizzia gypsea CBS 118893]EFQ99406.1 hypothetical protein MGYG_02418 [Nannizzia gypsea CBS 118893]
MMSSPLKSSAPKDQYVSAIWQDAIDKYYEKLKDRGVREHEINPHPWDVRNPEELLNQIQPSKEATSSKSWMDLLSRLRPILVSLNDFAAIITLAAGMNSRLAAVIWGSIRLILKFAEPVPSELLDMFEELGRALPRFRRYEQELPLTSELEEALHTTYTEIILFCADSILHFRNNPNPDKSRETWMTFSSEVSKHISNIRFYSRKVDETADMVRLSRGKNTADTVKAIENLHLSRQRSTELNLPCFMIPYGLNVKFFGRSAEVETMKERLDPNKNSGTLKIIAICGTGGVGKTQLALHYANTATDLYDVVVWIPGETKIKMTQALSQFSAKVGLPQTEGNEDDYRSIQIVHDWLNTSGKSFLLIFDNVEENKLLDQIWPRNVQGSIIITCRSHKVASKRATEVINLPCFDAEKQVDVFYSLTGQQPKNETESAAATGLLRLLGGLPLAMAQVGEFMEDRGYSYEELFSIYQKSAKKIYARTPAPAEYEHTLNTVWEVSFQELSNESKTLLNLLSFFDPDFILESIISDRRAGITDPELEFLYDSFDFGGVVGDLSKAALVSRLSAQKAISIHRLIQFTVFSRLSEEESSRYFNHVINILSRSFPNTWNQRSHQQGHGWASWETCSTILPHVSWLIRLTQGHPFRIINHELFAELVFRAGTYLWEKEQPITGTQFLDFGLELDIRPSTPTYAQAYRILGHIALDMARPKAALSAYLQALNIREQLHGNRSPQVADVYDSIACSYTEQGNVDEALQYLQKAEDIHNENNPLLMGRTQAIYALTYLRGDQPEDSLKALHHCWKLQNLTEEQVAQSKYPKHSGDIMLLARIKYAQGLKQEAQQLASRTIGIRQGLYGDKGPRVADSTFIVARMLEAEDEDTLAAKMLRSVTDMSRGVPEMQAHLARSLWFLAKVEEKMGNIAIAEKAKIEAREEREKVEGREGIDEDSDESFMSLVPWMLW